MAFCGILLNRAPEKVMLYVLPVFEVLIIYTLARNADCYSRAMSISTTRCHIVNNQIAACRRILHTGPGSDCSRLYVGQREYIQSIDRTHTLLCCFIVVISLFQYYLALAAVGIFLYVDCECRICVQKQEIFRWRS